MMVDIFVRTDPAGNIKPDKEYIGDQITLFTDRCIMCTRCVRFTREVTGSAALQVVSRGSHEEIDIFPGHPVNIPLAGNVVVLTPVGALCSIDFLYQQRLVLDMKDGASCPRQPLRVQIRAGNLECLASHAALREQLRTKRARPETAQMTQRTLEGACRQDAACKQPGLVQTFEHHLAHQRDGMSLHGERTPLLG